MNPADDSWSRYAATPNLFATVHHTDPRRRPPPRMSTTPPTPPAQRSPQPADAETVSSVDRHDEHRRPWSTAAIDPPGRWPATDRGVAPLLAAAARARVRYPGPVGELIYREIHSYLEIGNRFGGDTLINRIAEHLLAELRHEPVAVDPTPTMPPVPGAPS